MLDWRFLHPGFLFLLPLPLIWLIWHYRSRARRHPSILFSDTEAFVPATKSLRIKVLHALPLVRALVLILGIVALSRPQYGQIERRQAAHGIDISMALDISETMDYPDFEPSRLAVAKEVMKEFVTERINDRISVVVFGKSASLLAPPTFDREAVTEFIDAISPDLFAREHRMTAIGMGLALAVDKLKDSHAKSKVAILLTDGENNEGTIQPMQAAEAAKALGIRVYTIGVGSNQDIRVPTTDAFGFTHYQVVQATLDEDTLMEMAEVTGGKYFRATNEDALKSIYEEIDLMERTEIEVSEYDDFEERFMWLWTPALALLGLEYLLRSLWLVRLP